MAESDGRERVRFETPEDVEVAFDLAGPGSRIAAGLVDYAIIGAVTLGLVAALASAHLLAFRFQDLFDRDALAQVGNLAIALIIVVVSAVNLLYFVASEWLLFGQSPGKRILGIRVVREGGYAVSVSASFIRNLMRLVDVLPGPYLVGIASIMISRERRRLGDRVAGTLVVREARGRAPEARFVGERYSTLEGRQFQLEREAVDALGPEWLAVLDGYFDRVDGLAPEPARALTRTLALRFAERLGVVLAPDDEARARALLRETYLALRERLDA